MMPMGPKAGDAAMLISQNVKGLPSFRDGGWLNGLASAVVLAYGGARFASSKPPGSAPVMA